MTTLGDYTSLVACQGTLSQYHSNLMQVDQRTLLL